MTREINNALEVPIK